ncbi:hypothetical protein A3Q56_04705 [Intoshia linei]|uniref:Dynein heavy chain 6, axonemal n=1 Tax=Intoshia linei TaxID=1819745 RepID=A0A177B1F4_9BILA|nr:hypothetical protein A3Q56_04705 [Intoshia linei]
MSTQKITLPYIESSKEDSIMEKKLRDSKDSALIVKYRSRKNLKFHWPVNRQNENIFKRVHIEPLPLLKNHQKVNSPEYLKNMKREPLELRNAIDPTYRKKRAKGSIIRDDFVTRQLVDDVSVQNAWAEKVQNTIRDDNNSKYYGLKNMLVVVDIVRNFKNDTFLYLVPTCSHSNVKYDYYNLKVVSYDKIDKNNYCTISKHGVCRMRKDDETEFIKLDRWEIEILSFNSLIKIKLFKHFRMWKAYTVWKINVRHKNTREAAKYLEENLFILKDSLRPAILNVREMCYRMSDMSMCQFDELKTYDLDSFIETQCKQISAVGERLNEFHDLVKEVIRSACRTALLEEGFTPDDYFYDTIENSEAYRSATASSSYIMQSNYDMDLYAEAPDKMTYTEQSKKRSHCRRLTSFIRLIDYLIVTTLHVLSVNSISIILSQLTHHVENSPKKEEIAEWIEKNEDDTDMCGPVLSEVERNTPESSNTPNEENKINPLFIISLNMDKQGQITFNPSESTFHSQMDSLIKKYKEAVLKLKNLVADTFFDSFTRPIINNKFEEKTCGDGPCLPFMFDDDVKLNNICTNIHNSIGAAFTAGYYYSSTFQPIAKFFSENEQKDLNLIKKQDHNIDFFSESLNIYYKQHKLANMIVPYKNLGLMLIDSVEAKKKIIPSPLRCISVIDELLPEKAKKDVEILNSELQDAEFRLEQQPITTIDYVDSLNFLDDIQKRIEPLQKESHIIDDMYNLINFYKVPKRDVDYAVYKTLSGSINKVLGLIDKSLAERDQNLDCFCTKIEKDILELTHEVKKVKSEIHNPLLLDINSERETISTSLNTIQEQIEEFQERAFTYKSYQKNFQVELTTYEELEEVDAELKLKQLLWSSLDEWNKTWEEWISVPLKSLDPENLTEITKKFQKTIYQLEKGLPPNSVVPHLKGLVENMRDKLTTIANLVNPALRDRHIESIETVLEYNFTEEDPMTLSKLIDIDAFDLSESINEISGQASSEASLEMLLKKVKNSWKTCEFNVLPFRDTKDVYILGGVDDIQMILENSNIAISTIASSRHVGPIKHEVDDWILQLDLFSHTVDEWLICQRNWLYLESIFSAPDIQRQLPAESKMFITVDKSYKLIMKKLNKMPLALRSGTQPGLLNTLQNNNMLLDQILKCLEAYLESKRMIFSRFYFLSNDELLEILAQTRNPMAVQPHLRKCFDAISKLEFGVLPKSTPLNVDGLTTDFNKSVDDFDATSSNVGHSDDADVIAYSNDILAMISPEGERVPMTKGLKARGNVEEWLCKVEDSMFASLRKLTISSLADYEKKPRLEWVKGHAAQVVLTVSQIIWANNIMNILTNKNKDQCQNSLINFEQSSYKDLNDLASMVRTKLDKILRIIICALITIDVHARDIVTELKNQNVSSVESFEWQKQLKYYWDININNCIIRMSNSTYTYGYEYLGASSRLVITALTDRCYLCLMGALQLNLGGAPAGPAGTGKTESTKDLSKALGKQCVVFNCSDGIDYQMMGRFFSGLAQSGAWCCFDEFNRIYIEVLSVIAQQLITIRNAKANKLSVFMFEGREIKLHPDCAAFITMNPGYAGRTELPDNLKALFRPISMMVPDYKQIAEVILYSEGFESSKKLAQKMAQMYQLCSEQLSQQDHYDFGMRAVKSVLVMAGSLKRQHTNKPEDVAILQDLFPSVEIPAYDYGSVKAEIESVILNKNMQLVPNQVTKVIELYETMIVRHGVMLVGPTGSGKTVIYQTLAEICQNLSTSNTDMQNPFFVPVHKFVLNPKSITLGELFGQYNPLTLEWSDGLMGLLVRAAVRHTNSDHQWIICDGPVDAVWIENMNTVLDDNKMLCLANSERIKLTEFIHMIFEVQDLKAASPATVSRCGMVYCDANGLKWNSLVGSWIDVNLTKLDPEMKQFLIGLFNDYVEDGLQYARNKCIQIIDQVDIAKVVTLMKLLDGLLIENMDKLNLVPKNKKAKNIISTIFVFCYIWSIGGNLIDLYRDPFDTFVRHKFEDCPEAKLPTSAELWSYYYDVENKRMESWERSVPHFIYKQNVPFFEILVPTCDTVRYRYFMKMLLSIKKSVMFIGPSGVGKSVIVRKLLESMKDDSTIPVFINFSAQTTSQRTQEMIETKLIKKGTNMYGKINV